MQFCLLGGLLAADPVCVGTGTKNGLINLDQLLVLRYGCNLMQLKQQYGHEVYVFPGFAYARKRYPFKNYKSTNIQSTPAMHHQFKLLGLLFMVKTFPTVMLLS